jgi:hypothetical protein
MVDRLKVGPAIAGPGTSLATFVISVAVCVTECTLTAILMAACVAVALGGEIVAVFKVIGAANLVLAPVIATALLGSSLIICSASAPVIRLIRGAVAAAGLMGGVGIV